MAACTWLNVPGLSAAAATGRAEREWLSAARGGGAHQADAQCRISQYRGTL